MIERMLIEHLEIQSSVPLVDRAFGYQPVYPSTVFTKRRDRLLARAMVEDLVVVDRAAGTQWEAAFG